MNLNLRGKTAVVCGSTQGLGLASAIELALLGSKIVLMARNEEKMKALIPSLPNPYQQEHE